MGTKPLPTPGKQCVRVTNDFYTFICLPVSVRQSFAWKPSSHFAFGKTQNEIMTCTVSYNQALNCQMVFSYYYGQCEPHRVWTLCTQIRGRQTCHHFSHSSAIHKIVWNYASERVYSMHRGTQCKAWSWLIWCICVACLKHPRLRFCNHYLHFFWYMFGFSQWRV